MTYMIVNSASVLPATIVGYAAESQNQALRHEPKKKDYLTVILFLWLRGQDSNLRPRGYEPRELPLLHPASSKWLT